MSGWSSVTGSMASDIKSISRTIKGYDYSSEHDAEATDVKMCEFMIEEIRKAKDALFHIIQAAYELHEERLNRHFEGLRDDLDIFCDEIKIRDFHWSADLSPEWLGKLVTHDSSLISQMGRLNQELDDVYRLFMEAVKLYPEKTDPGHLEKIREYIKLLGKAVDRIVLTFRERDVICNLKPLSLEKTYQQMQDYNRRLI
jgi:hypothetical protein